MTARKIESYGLIAGISMGDMMDMAPGEIIDLFLYRRKYDDTEHGIRRE